MKISRRYFLKILSSLSLWLFKSNAWGNVCLPGMTLEQSLGPFYPDPKDPNFSVREKPDLSLPWPEANDNDLTLIKGLTEKAKGQVIYLTGQCFDEKCDPIAGAKIILWQASASGRYNHLGDRSFISFKDPRSGNPIERKHDPNFQYWGHALSDNNGNYIFKTIIPGFYPADLNSEWFRPPHLHFIVKAEGYSILTTQTYFRGNDILDHKWIQYLNSQDYVLRSSGSLEEQSRLIVEYKIDPKNNGELLGNFNFYLNSVKGLKSFFNFQ
tara:strand:+ start:4341 stop:5147 length:807 start_codon:yes stop_codon:yes gene_type:complete